MPSRQSILMDFRIADTFTAALGRLTSQEQKATKTTAFDLQLDPSAPGLKFHRIDKSRDPHFWSVRANQDIRIIIHKTEASFLLAYVDHHDRAYAWAERRRIEAHPRTGAIQIVETRELAEDLPSPSAVPLAVAKGPTPAALPALFGGLTDDALLGIGAPSDWLADIYAATEDTFFELAERLPGEVAEALLEYVSTGLLTAPEPVAASADPFTHPDTLRRVRTVESEAALHLALDYPWDRWSVFLHPSQAAVVERVFSGPARVLGTAGTGKTVVALHRAARAAMSDPQARVLLTTFSRPLANALRPKVDLLLLAQPEVGRRVTVAAFDDVASELHELAFGRRPAIAADEVLEAILQKEADEIGGEAARVRFLAAEWRQVIDAWAVDGLEGYASVPRIGRRSRMGAKQRERLWPVFESTRRSLGARGLMTWPQVFHAVAGHFATHADKPFSHVIVDEAQDLGAPQLKMLAAVCEGPGLFFAGDLGQRIFQPPFSWRAMGVDLRGRSSTLKVNYRTSRQIRESADRLLPPEVRDADGLEDDRRGAMSVFEGPPPAIMTLATQEAADDGVPPEEIGVFVRSTDQLQRARAAVRAAGLTSVQLTERAEDPAGRVSIGTMHLAKGLEFKAVVVMACDDDVLPLQSRIDGATDEDELREVYDTERQLFYVACTRARDRLQITGVRPASEFIGDLTTR